MTVSDVTERDLIARIRQRLAPPPEWVVIGIGDDAAVVEPARNRLEVLTVDALVEGVHFDRAFTPPSAIGHRALAVNLSDLAAMGATPRLALLSLALPPTLALADYDEMIAGFTDLAARFRMTVVGGNLTRIEGPLVLDVTVIGTVKRRQTLTRAGARPGDHLYVTGSIGAAAAGLQMLRARKLSTTEDTKDTEEEFRSVQNPSSVSPVSSVVESTRCIRRFLYPEPRLRMGTLVGRNRAATACMDLSDGLADAVTQMCEASGVGATIEAGALPIALGARQWFDERRLDPVLESISGGDDYELLLAARPRLRRRLTAAERHGDAPLTHIGTCTADRAILLRRDGADQPMPPGYTHFR